MFKYFSASPRSCPKPAPVRIDMYIDQTKEKVDSKTIVVDINQKGSNDRKGAR